MTWCRWTLVSLIRFSLWLLRLIGAKLTRWRCAHPSGQFGQLALMCMCGTASTVLSWPTPLSFPCVRPAWRGSRGGKNCSSRGTCSWCKISFNLHRSFYPCRERSSKRKARHDALAHRRGLVQASPRDNTRA